MELFGDRLTQYNPQLAIGIMVFGLLFGIFLELIIMGKIKGAAKKATWKGDGILLESLQGIGMLACALAGVYFALELVEIETRARVIFQNILISMMVLGFMIAGLRLVNKMGPLWSKMAGREKRSLSILLLIPKTALVFIAAMMVMNLFGITILPMLAALGIAGLAVALALQETLTNLIAGFHLVAAKNIRSGQFVQLSSGEQGLIQDITWRYTTLLDPSDYLIVVPNSKMSNAILINYNLPEDEIGFSVPVDISHDNDLDKVEKITVDVAKNVMEKVEGGVPGYEPFVWYTDFEDRGLKFIVVMRSKDRVSQFLLKHEFLRRLNTAYRREKVKLAYPIRKVNINGSNPRP